MTKRAPLTQAQQEFIQRYIGGLSKRQANAKTEQYQDYLGRRSKARASIEGLTPGSQQRTALETLLKNADDKANQGDFKGAYADLKQVKVDARRAARGFASTLTANGIQQEIAQLSQWVDDRINHRAARQHVLGPGYDAAIAPLRNLAPVSSKTNKTSAFKHLKTVNEAIKAARLALATHKATVDNEANSFGASVQQMDLNKKIEELGHKLTVWGNAAPGNSNLNLLQALTEVTRKAQAGRLHEAKQSFMEPLTPLYQQADLALPPLSRTLTDLSKFARPDAIFTDNEGKRLSPRKQQAMQETLAERFKAAEERAQARLKAAREQMELDSWFDEDLGSYERPQNPIQHFATYDTTDLYDEVTRNPLPPRVDEWMNVGMIKDVVDKLKPELDRLAQNGGEDPELRDLALKTPKEWMQDIADNLGIDLTDQNIDVSLKQLVQDMALRLQKECGQAFPNRAAPDLSTFTMNGVVYDTPVRLGAGGGGEVYTYTNTVTGQKIVVKRPLAFSPDSPLDPREFDDLASEIRNHYEATGGPGNEPDNVLGIKGMVMAPNGQPMLCMDLADGGDVERLGDSLNASAEVGLISDKARQAMVQDTVRQLALGIKQIQESGMSHHDLKEANVFVMSDGTLKVADFGLANILDDHDQMVEMIVGTPGYEPDELNDERRQGQKSDNFTLGAIISYMTSPTHHFGDDFESFAMQRIPRQQTTEDDPEGEDGEQRVVMATALDRLRNQLLSHDRGERPEMSGVLASAYLDDLDSNHTQEDLEELKLATIEYSKKIGNQVGRLSRDIQFTLGEIQNLELDKFGKLEEKKLKYRRTQMEKFIRQRDDWQQKLNNAVAGTKAHATATEQLQVRLRFINQLQGTITNLENAQGRQKSDSEIQALDQKIQQKRQQIAILRNQIKQIHENPQNAQVVDRLRKANEAFQ